MSLITEQKLAVKLRMEEDGTTIAEAPVVIGPKETKTISLETSETVSGRYNASLVVSLVDLATSSLARSAAREPGP